MKQQESIVTAMKNDGKSITFERFTQKTVKGILNQYRQLTDSAFAKLFFDGYKNSDYILFERTPDHYGRDRHEMARFTPTEFFKAIGYTAGL